MRKSRASRLGLVVPFAVATALSLATLAPADVFQSYTGLLSTSNTSVNAGGLWSHDATITWQVDNNSPSFNEWHYSYTFTVLNSPSATIRSLDLRTASNFTPGDMLSLNWGGGFALGAIDSTVNRPAMPQDVYGMTFSYDGNGYTTWKFSFDTTRSPEWGDFYARGTSSNWAVNKGFKSPLADLPLEDYPLQDGSVFDSLLVPGATGGDEVGRTGVIRVVKFNDYDRAGTARSDANFGLADWWIHADSNSGSVPPQQTGTDGSVLFAPLNGDFPWTITEANSPAGWEFVEAFIYNDANGALVARVTDPNQIFVDISMENMTVLLGNIYVPEPATLALLGCGFAIALLRRRRRCVTEG